MIQIILIPLGHVLSACYYSPHIVMNSFVLVVPPLDDRIVARRQFDELGQYLQTYLATGESQHEK
jgi:hypothetical protein